MNPDMVVAAITQESARAEHVEALARVHPDILDSMTRQIGHAIDERRDRGMSIPIETARQYALLQGDHRLLPRIYDPEHAQGIQDMYQAQREKGQQGARRKASPQLAQKEMTSLQRSLEGRA